MKKLIAFFEIPASDFHRAVDFYETVLGMQLPTFECETEKMACFTEEGETIGAISYASNFDFLPSTHGGKVVIPRTKIEADGKGWFAVFTDSEGNRIGIYAEK